MDERPCNYDFCGFMVQNNNEINFVRPEKSDLGLKKTPAEYLSVKNFLSRECADADYLILGWHRIRRKARSGKVLITCRNV